MTCFLVPWFVWYSSSWPHYIITIVVNLMEVDDGGRWKIDNTYNGGYLVTFHRKSKRILFFLALFVNCKTCTVLTLIKDIDEYNINKDNERIQEKINKIIKIEIKLKSKRICIYFALLSIIGRNTELEPLNLCEQDYLQSVYTNW